MATVAPPLPPHLGERPETLFWAFYGKMKPQPLNSVDIQTSLL